MIERRPTPWTRAAGLVLALVAVAALVLGTAGPASAHATLLETDPAEGAVLETAPERIRFSFDESVALPPDGVQVFDAQGGPIGASASASGSDLDVTLTDEVEQGTLVVVWRIVSKDGHPIVGSLSFSIGAPSAEVERPAVSSAGMTEPPLLLGIARGLGYVGLLLAVGLVGFTVLLLPASHLADRARRRLVTGARAGAAVTVLAWLTILPLTAIYRSGEGAGALTTGSTWSTLPWAEYGVLAAVVVGVVVAVGLLGGGLPVRRRGLAAVVAGAVAVGAPALTGHTRAATPEILVVGADVLHLVAACVWLGGLVALAITLPDLAGRDTLAAEVLTRFSTVAAGVLAALAVTGSLLAWRILKSWSALLESSNGRLLMVKVAVVAVALAIAAWNRYGLLPRVRAATRRRERRAGAGLVVRTTTVEAVVLVVVLLITGLLVDKTPKVVGDGGGSASDSRPAPLTSTLGEVELAADLAPRAVGSSTVTIRLTGADGAPTEGIEPPIARLSSGDVALGDVPLAQVMTGTYAGKVVLPAPGTWELQVSLRTSEFTNPVATLDFVIDGD